MKMWIYRNLKISWADRVYNQEVLRRMKRSGSNTIFKITKTAVLWAYSAGRKVKLIMLLIRQGGEYRE